MSKPGDDIPFADEPGSLPFQIVLKAPHRTNWPAFDVPRTHDILEPENDKIGWEQVNGFIQLSDLLHSHYQSLTKSRNALANAWQSPAAEAILARIDKFTESLLSDARCARTTASGLHGILDAQATAKLNVGELYRKWQDVTTDVLPEWWDKAARGLNNEAVVIMDQADVAVRDHRSRIILPKTVPVEDLRIAGGSAPSEPPEPMTTPQPGSRTSSSQGIPPVPGFEPTIPSGGGPELAGGLGAIPPVPGQPVSMLPIPPGNHYAPYGGAYVLPGPGVGKTGYVVPMPPPSSGAVRGGVTGAGGYGGGVFGSAGKAGVPGAPGSGGMMPMMGMAPAAAPGGGGQNSGTKGGRADTKWQVEQGVPPIIEGINDQAVIPGQPSAHQEEAFKDWFAELAYPWRTNTASDSQEPQVILRKAKP